MAKNKNKQAEKKDIPKAKAPERKGKSLLIDAEEQEQKGNEIIADERFPDINKEKKEEEKKKKKEAEEKEKPFGSEFKKANKKEERLKKLYTLKNKLKEKLGITPKPTDETGIITAVVIFLLKIFDFSLNAFFIVLMAIAGVLGIFAIRDGAEPLNIIAICLFILTLGYVCNNIKG